MTTRPRGATNLVSIYARGCAGCSATSSGKLLRTRAPGYQLAWSRRIVDSLRFDALVGAGRLALAGQQRRSAPPICWPRRWACGGAARSWTCRSSALVGGRARRLEEARLDVLELSIEAEIGCGRHAQVIAELSRLTADHPLREGLWGLLMRALDAAGRHAEALAAYARAREVIAEELGVDPGEKLQTAVRADPDARQSPAAASAGAVVRSPRRRRCSCRPTSPTSPAAART